MQIAVAYVATLVAFLLIDLVWLGVVAKDFYRRELGGLMADKIESAILYYEPRVKLESVRAIAEAGVDLISSGSLTHSATVLDIGLDFEIGR